MPLRKMYRKAKEKGLSRLFVNVSTYRETHEKRTSSKGIARVAIEEGQKYIKQRAASSQSTEKEEGEGMKFVDVVGPQQQLNTNKQTELN